jgi:CheY-like chemotaxis protein
MPVMDGMEATRLIRDDEVRGGLQRVPIIAMTADCMPEVEERCVAVGMDEVHHKPIAAKKIEAAIARWTKNRRQPPAAAASG